MSESSVSKYTPDAERFFRRIREQLPSFTEVDDKGRNDWEDDEGPLGYISVAALARHLTDLAGRGEWDKVKAVLDVAEAAIEADHAFTSELMVAGLLEDFQNAALQSDGLVRLVDVRAMLGPCSMKAWDDLMRFCHGSRPTARRRLPRGSLPR